jgi:hypothetical protein
MRNVAGVDTNNTNNVVKISSRILDLAPEHSQNKNYNYKTNSFYGTSIRRNFTRILSWTAWFSDFRCDSGSPDGRDGHMESTDLIYKRHVCRFLYFLYVVFGTICKEFPSLWRACYLCCSNFGFSNNPFVMLHLCPLMHTSNC